MEFIKLIDSVITPEECSLAIKHYLNTGEKISEDQYPIHNAPIKELNLSGSGDLFWDSLENKLKSIAEKELTNYFVNTKYKDPASYYLSHMSIMQYKEFYNKPSHYDFELDYRDKKELLRLFAILVYLNDDFEGGELMFPLQNKTIKPVPGLMVIFPTSFMYPHLTLPAYGKERFVLRLNYFINKNIYWK